MSFSIRYSEEKNQLLKATRGVSFPEVIRHLKSGDLLADKQHHSLSRSSQRIYIVKIGEYAYVVPYVINQDKKEIFLKTAYPSRRFTKQYLKEGGQNAK